MINLITRQINQPQTQRVNKSNLSARSNNLSPLNKDVFAPSFCASLKLPVKAVKAKGQEYLAKLTDKLTMEEKSDLLDKYICEVKDLGLKVLDAKQIKDKKYFNDKFCGDFCHEFSGSYVNGYRLKFVKLIKSEGLSATPAQHEIANGYLNSAVNHVNNAYKQYQFFLDKNLHSGKSSQGVKKVFNMIMQNFSPLAKEKNIKLEIEGQDILEKYSKFKSKDYEDYIIKSNLFGNAIKYSPENSVINIGFVEKDNGLHFVIKDQGIGIPEKDQEKVLSHHRASNVGDIPGSGYGLGRVAQLLKEEVGGKITITSPLYPDAPKYKGTIMECPLICDINQKISWKDKIKNTFGIN